MDFIYILVESFIVGSIRALPFYGIIIASFILVYLGISIGESGNDN